MLTIGLKRGTSMDGIDAALLETDGSANSLKDLGHCFLPYEPKFKILLKAAEYAARKCLGNMEKAHAYYLQGIHDYLANEFKLATIDIDETLSQLSHYLHAPKETDAPITLDKVIQHSTYLHGVAVKKLLGEKGYETAQIDVIGYHGQTLFHNPSEKISIIVGNGQALAEQVAIKVINDFRSNDIAAGGQGAPFAPLYHHALAVRDQKIPVAIINCGGISNVTLIQNKNPLTLIGFDTGPGNGLIDRLVKQRTLGKENMDLDGQYGKNGKVQDQILKALYEKSIHKNNQNYFSMLPPKSLDQGDMKLIPELDALSLEDACATLEAFTADTIIQSCTFLNTELPQQWILSGGGWKNPVILQEFEHRLSQKLGKNSQIFTADDIGWNSQAMEAQIFAYLAVCSLQNKPISFPGTTGVPAPLSGGKIHRVC